MSIETMEPLGLHTCIICLAHENLIGTEEADPNDIDLRTKLKFCLPELDWNVVFFMCPSCARLLDALCAFRNRCLNTFVTRREILDHDKGPVRCRLCLLVFNYRAELSEHNKIVHHSENPHDCLLCCESFTTYADVADHETLHYQLQKHRCDVCNTAYASEGLLDSHRLFKHCSDDDWHEACPYCGIKYPTEEYLKAHVQVVHEKKTNCACYHCGLDFERKSSLLDHIKLEHVKSDEIENGSYVCQTCNSVHSTKKKLEIHKIVCFPISEDTLSQDAQPDSDTSTTHRKTTKTKRRTKKRGPKVKEKLPAMCQTCGITFSTKYLLNRHVRNVHATEKNHHCDVCDQRFASPVYLAAHKKYHSGSRPHICSFCGKGYITASDLYHHEKIHANKRAYKCDKCPKAFNTSSDLHKHRICVHVDRSEWKYVCNYCDRRFPLKTNLDTHTKTHTGERNYACHLCERRCINRSVLQRHIDSHSNVRSFKCVHCSQEYKYQKSLDIHLAKAHGMGNAKIPERVKKYFCHVCSKSYFANNKLQKHIRTHTGERPFSCHLCQKTFIDKSYVKQHLKATHGVSRGDPVSASDFYSALPP